MAPRIQFSEYPSRVHVFDFIPAGQHAAILDFTSSYDATAAIQNAINQQTLGSTSAVVYSNLESHVFLPRGRFNTTDSLHMGYGNGGYSAARVFGDGQAYRGESGFRGPVIIPNFSDRPAVVIQGARGSILRGVSIKGLNYDHIFDDNLGDVSGLASIDDTAGSAWVDPALHANADSRYAPYAGIAIDPYNGVEPGTPYPDVTYPAFMGAVAQYGKASSSQVLIEDVSVGGFVVAVVINPSNGDGNGDFVRIKRSTLEICRYGISVGHTQSRNVHIEDVNMSRVHTALTNKAHGIQTGRFMGPVTNLHVDNCINVFDFGSTSILGEMTFINLYCEATYRLGDITPTSATESSITFINSHLSLGGQNDVRGHPATILGTGSQAIPIRYFGGSITSFTSVAGFNFSQNSLQFEGTQLAPTSSRTNPYEKFAHNALAGGLALQQLGGTASQNRRPSTLKFRGYNLDTGGDLGALIVGPHHASKRTICTPIYVEDHQPYNGTQGDFVPLPTTVTAISKAAVTGSMSGRTLTLTFGARTDAVFAYSGPLPGDVIWDDQTGSVFFVRSRIALVVLAELQNNYKVVTGTPTVLSSISMVTGNWYVANSRLYMPEYFLRVDATAGSATLANASRADGFATFLDTSIVADDYIYIDDQRESWLSRANSKVASFNSATPSITVAGNVAAGHTEVRKRIGTMIRLPPANV